MRQEGGRVKKRSFIKFAIRSTSFSLGGFSVKKLNLILVSLLILAFAAPAFGQVCYNAPKDGVYTTNNGTMIGGRASEAWCAGLGPGQPGNTENAQSWDGAVLGGQWKVWGMASEGAVETARYFDVYGNGWIDYATNYTGGQFWLSGTGSWGSGATDYTGLVTYFNVAARVTYVAGSPVGVTSNILLMGTFDNCTHCQIQYAISNALLVWQTGYPTVMLADYPPFLCGAASGELFDACCIVAKIFCQPTAVDESTWGAIKSLYR
ncbi:MAG: hypothetical protein WC528_04725 [Patescibacteria group bacterium]